MLTVEGLSAGYGSVPVIRDFSFKLATGEVLLIGGENGAGKSTLVKALAGLIKATAGVVKLDGTDITGFSPQSRVKHGLRLVLDGHRVFPEISVQDNLKLAMIERGGSTFEQLLLHVYATYPILREKRRAWARDLSGGQQQMLALGQALMAQPRVILCDEPSLGLAHSLMPLVMKSLKQLTIGGTAVVVVEQMLDLALPIADRVIMMEHGAIRSEGSVSDMETSIMSVSRGRERLRALARPLQSGSVKRADARR